MPAFVARTAAEESAADGAGLDRDPAARSADTSRTGAGARPALLRGPHLMRAAVAPGDLGRR